MKCKYELTTSEPALATGGVLVGGLTNTCTSAVDDWPDESVTFSTNVYTPSDKFDN